MSILEFRTLIAKHWDVYVKLSRIKQQKQPYMAQIAGYEAQKIHTAFLVSVKNNLGNCLRRAVNMLCRSKIEALAKRIELKAAGASADTIRDTLRAEVWGPVDKAKECVKRGNIVEAELDAHIYERVKDLQSAFDIYENDALSEKGLYYDIKCDPIKHVKAFFLLARFFQQNKPRSFQCMPLRTQWIPCHVHIDKAILCQWFLGGIKKEQKLTNDLWGEVLDINCRVVKSKQSGKVFEGSVQTDGVSISIFKKCKAKKKNTNSTDQTSDIKTPGSASTATTKTPKTKKGKDEDGFEFEYIESIGQDKLCAMEGNCMLIDPGRRGLLFCMHEYGSVGNPWLFRFTRNHKAKLTRSTKFRRILEAAKKMYPDNAIIEAEQRLAEVPCTTVDLDQFKRFIEVQAEVWPLLSKFYSCTQTNSTTNKKPLYWQLRLAAYLSSQRADHVLANLIREQFGPDPVLVLGNWFAGMCKYHERIRGVGMRRMLRKHRFKVYLLDEFRTSTFCPGCCEDRLVHPEELVPNPRPYPKEDRREYVTCHGLLMCQNKKWEYVTDSMEPAKHLGKEPAARFWNRDLAAVLNFRHILYSLRQTHERPERFRRGTTLPPARKPKKPARGAKRSVSVSTQPKKKPRSAKAQPRMKLRSVTSQQQS
ncbi:hypothetical protein LPJ74_005407 [Coemansia sp. RSA 1843]|nr:hypothetical protein LPJ74_005407 [Coemansia sp. RSA 1843]